MSGFRLVAYLYRCTVCGIEYQVQAGEQTVLACNHPLAGQNYSAHPMGYAQSPDQRKA